MNDSSILGFYATEFMPPEICNNAAIDPWWFIDIKVVQICAEIKKDFGKPVIINNWKAGGQFKNSGFRMPDCTEGAKLSQHRFGRAADVKVQDATADEVRKLILDKKQKYMGLGLTTLEDAAFAPTWCHFDIRRTGMTDILIVKP